MMRLYPQYHYKPINHILLHRYHHVYQLVVRPTWETHTVLKKLKGRVNFRIQLMDGEDNVVVGYEWIKIELIFIITFNANQL